MNNLVANYIPKEAKARALGLCLSGFHTGMKLAPSIGLDKVLHTRTHLPHPWQFTGLSTRKRQSLCHSAAPLSMKVIASSNGGAVSYCVHCAGNLAGLLLSPILLVNYGWRALFLIFGLLGGPLLALWLSVVPKK
jgi:hypothetical protein